MRNGRLSIGRLMITTVLIVFAGCVSAYYVGTLLTQQGVPGDTALSAVLITAVILVWLAIVIFYAVRSAIVSALQTHTFPMFISDAAYSILKKQEAFEDQLGKHIPVPPMGKSGTVGGATPKDETIK